MDYSVSRQRPEDIRITLSADRGWRTCGSLCQQTEARGYEDHSISRQRSEDMRSNLLAGRGRRT